MGSRSVVGALGMAIQRRRPEAGLLARPDRGSQYAGDHYRRALSAEGIVCGMSEVGRCWGSAPVGSLFGRLMWVIGPGGVFAARGQARAELLEYLEVFGNRVRRHCSLGFLPPAGYERAHKQKRR